MIIFNLIRIIRMAKTGDGVISDARSALFLFKNYYIIKELTTNSSWSGIIQGKRFRRITL